MSLLRALHLICLSFLVSCTTQLTKDSSSDSIQTTIDVASVYYDKAFELLNQSKDEEAIEWVEKAARLGHAQAQFLLGYMLHTGTAGYTHLSKAKEWYLLAAKQGVDEAQFNLGVLSDNKPEIPAHFLNAKLRHATEKASKATEENSIIIGKVLGYVDIPLIQPVSCFEPNMLCMDAFVTYKIAVKDVFSGESLSGVIHASRYQHTRHIYRGSDLSLFVITKIKDEKKAYMLKADYFLREHVSPATQYCFSDSAEDYFSDLQDVFHSPCMSVTEFYQGIKYDFFESVAESVKTQLENDSRLTSFDQGTSLNGDFISYDSDEEGDCPSDLDMDKYLDVPACHAHDQVFEVVKFGVDKGYGEEVKQLILSELNKTSLNFEKVKMTIKILDAQDQSVVEWSYWVPNIDHY